MHRRDSTARRGWAFLAIVAVLVGSAAAVIALLCADAPPSPERTAKAQEQEKTASSAPSRAPQTTAGWLGDGSGRYPNATPPTHWSPDRNIRWSVRVGANPFSSETIADGRIFLVVEPSLLVCVDAASGRVLWKKSNEFSDLPDTVEPTPAAGDPGNTTPTPVSDGRSVYVSFGCGIVACYDLEGQRKWIMHVKAAAPEYGRSASPVLVDDRLLVSIGVLTALDAATGRQVWKADAVKETYGTPAKAKIGGVDVVVAPTGEIVRVSDGAVLARTDGRLPYASPIVHDGVVYFVDATSVAVRLPDKADGKAQVETLWQAALEGEFFASPVYANGLLFTANGTGALYILDAKDGSVLAGKELEMMSAGDSIYGSLTAAGKYVFVNSTAGKTLVIEAAGEYREVAVNHLAEGSGATPVFDGGRMFIRGGETLYAISGQQQEDRPHFSSMQ